MWVLSTARAELRYFFDCAVVPGGYAILSHTWTQSPAGEQTLQDVREIIKKCKPTRENPRDHVCEKIRRCCEIAEREGYKWVWIDSCCIDKTSSTELSEAINSMFNWYALAEVCYVYLEDVPYDNDPQVWVPSFLRARWHSRGWTLQELLAPAFAIFFSKEWKKMGTKYELRDHLSVCTGINEQYLTREWDFRVDASVATRMSWAAQRKTTRVEDEAYCLLGLFDINMPTLYGEGRYAFQRLQEELARQNTDATLFVWGNCHISSHNEWEQSALSRNYVNHNPSHPYIFLFAPSPSSYSGGLNARSSPWTSSSARLPSSPNLQLDEKDNPLSQAYDKVPSFEVTPYGMKCPFPVASANGITIAVLPCQHNDEYLGLLLHPAPNVQDQGPSCKLYYVSWTFCHPTGSRYLLKRLAFLGSDAHDLRFRGNPVIPTWRDVYIIAHPSTTARTDGAHLFQRFVPDTAPTAFRIPRTLVQTLSLLMFSPDTKRISWDPASNNTMWFGCQSAALSEYVCILLGTCTKVSTGGRQFHWAWADHRHRATWGKAWPEYIHNCETDHIANWPDGTREFGDADRTIRLVFDPCMHTPERTLVLGLQLAGSVYEAIQKNANTRLPLPVRSSHEHLLTGAAKTDPNNSLGISTSPSASSRFLPRLTSVLKHSATGFRIGVLKTGDHSRRASSVRTLTRGRHTVSQSVLSDGNRAGPSNTHSATVDGLVNATSNPHEVMEELPMESDAPGSREIQELKEAHDAQTRKLNEALADIALLKTVFAQMSQRNSISAPLEVALEPP